jgi:hypothetical protein
MNEENEEMVWIDDEREGKSMSTCMCAGKGLCVVLYGGFEGGEGVTLTESQLLKALEYLRSKKSPEPSE